MPPGCDQGIDGVTCYDCGGPAQRGYTLDKRRRCDRCHEDYVRHHLQGQASLRFSPFNRDGRQGRCPAMVALAQIAGKRG